MTWRLFLVAIAAVFTVGCQTRIGDLTVASAKNLPVEFNTLQEHVEGKDCAHIVLLLIPIGTMNPTIDGAIDDALSKVNGADALVNATVKRSSLFAFIYNRACVTVEGTAISTR